MSCCVCFPCLHSTVTCTANCCQVLPFFCLFSLLFLIIKWVHHYHPTSSQPTNQPSSKKASPKIYTLLRGGGKDTTSVTFPFPFHNIRKSISPHAQPDSSAPKRFNGWNTIVQFCISILIWQGKHSTSSCVFSQVGLSVPASYSCYTPLLILISRYYNSV